MEWTGAAFRRDDSTGAGAGTSLSLWAWSALRAARVYVTVETVTYKARKALRKSDFKLKISNLK
jgi:hypothetical protein